MDDDLPIPREGKLKGWKHVTGTQMVGHRETPDACPFCKTDVQPSPGLLGQGGMGDDVNPEPWQETAQCPNPKCRASLRRVPGDPWIGTAA